MAGCRPPQRSAAGADQARLRSHHHLFHRQPDLRGHAGVRLRFGAQCAPCTDGVVCRRHRRRRPGNCPFVAGLAVQFCRRFPAHHLPAVQEGRLHRSRRHGGVGRGNPGVYHRPQNPGQQTRDRPQFGHHGRQHRKFFRQRDPARGLELRGQLFLGHRPREGHHPAGHCSRTPVACRSATAGRARLAGGQQRKFHRPRLGQGGGFLGRILRHQRADKKTFDAEGISIPFPQRDIHLYQKPTP